MSTKNDRYKEYQKLLQEKHLRVIHCYQITGENLYVLDMLFLDMENLNSFLQKIEQYGSYEVNIILKNIHEIEY
ncbi:Lrp/AsnC ligand binding domain-containing protein [Maridesulfovibrio sp.]|uniref:Lrp/AsnC ligand binding domain-containing protein n=1 Tax=Maridesulfovibrio sp. TaxID=2795000 RepID=UPI0038B4179C